MAGLSLSISGTSFTGFVSSAWGGATTTGFGGGWTTGSGTVIVGCGET